MQLPHKGPLDDLRQVGDGSKVGSVRRIEARLLQAKRDDGVLLALGESALGKRSIHDRCDERC